MHETEPDEKWITERADAAQPVEGNSNTTGPTEYQSIIITLLMRLYDVQITLLEHFDKDTAEAMWSKHNNGEHFNPTMFIPQFNEED